MNRNRACDRSDPGLQRAIQAAGGVAQLAKMLKVTLPAVAQWRRVPAQRVRRVADLTGVPEYTLRPDIFRRPSVLRQKGKR